MPFSPLIELGVLNQFLGQYVAQLNQTTTAGTLTGTTLTVRGSGGSGGIDVAIPANSWMVINGADIFQVTASASASATSLTVGTFYTKTSLSAGATICFALGSYSGAAAVLAASLPTLYAGLSSVGAQSTINGGTLTLPTGTITLASTTGFPNATNNVIIATETGWQNVQYTGTSGATLTGCTGGSGAMNTGDVVLLVPTAATLLTNEPTSTGSYARASVTNNTANWSLATSTYPGSKTNAASIAFPTSTGTGWSTGATALPILFIADSATLASGNVIMWAPIGNPLAVNSLGVTLSFASSQLTWTLL